MEKQELEVKFDQIQKELEETKRILMSFRIQRKLQNQRTFGKVPGVRFWIAYGFWRVVYRTEQALYQAVLKLF